MKICCDTTLNNYIVTFSFSLTMDFTAQSIIKTIILIKKMEMVTITRINRLFHTK